MTTRGQGFENRARNGVLSRRALLAGAAAMSGAGLASALPGSVHARQTTPGATPMATGNVWEQSPWWPWLTAHMNDENPPDVIGGPITTTASQEEGGAFWVFPGPRRLDPTIFGTPENPRGTEEPALFLGVPMSMREQTEGGGWQTAQPTPFSDTFAAVSGSVRSRCVDATAIDGATTKDEIDFEATFQAPEDQGEYRVTVTQALPHGWAFPTGGGVVTDVILHGVSGWGTRLMPTEFTYSAFWGPGVVEHNGEVIADPWPVHMMITEFVRADPYDLVFDENVDPNNRHLHLMVLPFSARGEPNPLPSGFMLPNGMEQPFLHVMFPSLTLERSIGG